MSVATLHKHIYSFIDFYKNNVEFTYDMNFFSDGPKHVWVICRFRNQWLLTRHLERGIEFPGGKVEEGEAPEKAAKREVYEETGGIVSTLTYLGQYKVTTKHDVVIKNVYFAQVNSIDKNEHYFETAGPILLDEIPSNVKGNKEYSFIMKDDVLYYSLKWVETNVLKTS